MKRSPLKFLTDSFASIDENSQKAEELTRREAKERDELERLQRTGAFDDDAIVEAAAKTAIRIPMFAHKREQLAKASAAKEEEISEAAAHLQRMIGQGLDDLCGKITEEIQATLSPWVDESRLPLAAEWLLSKSVWWAHIYEIGQRRNHFTKLSVDDARATVETFQALQELLTRWRDRNKVSTHEAKEAAANRS